MPQTQRFIFDLMDELKNIPKQHIKLIKEYEEKYRRNLFCYNTLLGHPAGSIHDIDSQILENLFRSVDISKYGKRLDLIINSPGGLPESAEKIIQTIKAYFKSFRAIIPNMAMSAATLVCMGADKILMSDTSRLGPIDPQMIFTTKEGHQVMRPAKVFIDAYTIVLQNAIEAISKGAPPQPFYRLLDNQDPSWIMQCIKARKATEILAKKFLKINMLSDKTDSEIDKVVKFFFDVGDTFTHGKLINADEAILAGLTITKIKIDSEFWSKIWEIYVRIERHTTEKTLAKYFVSREGSIEGQAKSIGV